MSTCVFLCIQRTEYETQGKGLSPPFCAGIQEHESVFVQVSFHRVETGRDEYLKAALMQASESVTTGGQALQGERGICTAKPFNPTKLLCADETRVSLVYWGKQPFALRWKDDNADRARVVWRSVDACRVRKISEAAKRCVISSVTGSTKQSQHSHQSLNALYRGTCFITK